MSCKNAYHNRAQQAKRHHRSEILAALSGNYSILETLLKECAEAKPSSGETAEILRFLFDRADDKHMPLSAYWMLIAAQGLGRELIGLLNPEDAAGLATFYRRRYPRRVRLPVQDQILKQLKLQAEKR